MAKAEKVYVILADPVTSSCTVNAVYIHKEAAEEWVAKENKKLGYQSYWIEQSQLIKEKKAEVIANA